MAEPIMVAIAITVSYMFGADLFNKEINLLFIDNIYSTDKLTPIYFSFLFLLLFFPLVFFHRSRPTIYLLGKWLDLSQLL
jgi:uncharacterized RDD family membrane protein YckC